MNFKASKVAKDDRSSSGEFSIPGNAQIKTKQPLGRNVVKGNFAE